MRLRNAVINSIWEHPCSRMRLFTAFWGLPQDADVLLFAMLSIHLVVVQGQYSACPCTRMTCARGAKRGGGRSPRLDTPRIQIFTSINVFSTPIYAGSRSPYIGFKVPSRVFYVHIRVSTPPIQFFELESDPLEDEIRL